MKKLYYSSSIVDCIFVADESSSDKQLIEQAKSWMEEDGNSGVYNPVSVFEITSINQIPKPWLDGIAYGQEETELTAKEWFEKRTEAISKKEKEEKELYLKLKQKYEP